MDSQKLIIDSLLAAISAPDEHDERPRDPMPSDEELNALYESYEANGGKGPSESEAYRLSH